MADQDEPELREVLRRALVGARQVAADNGDAALLPETWDLILDAEAFLDGRPTVIKGKGNGLVVLKKLIEGLKQYAER